MRPQKFNFEPVKKVNAKRKSDCKRGFSVNFKYQYIYFPLSYVEKNNLEGQMIKWFVDVEKKALGWKVLHENHESLLEDLKEYIKITRKNNQFRFQIGRVLHTFNFKDTNLKFKDLEVNEYTDTCNSHYNGKIHYLLLNPPLKK